MKSQERFIAALERKPIIGQVPHFELVFFLTMEAFGKVHPTHRAYSQWDQMSKKERNLHREDIANLYIDTAKKYDHDAIFLHPNPGNMEEIINYVNLINEKTNHEYFICIHGDATYSIPDGHNMVDFAMQMADDPDGLKDNAEKMVDSALATAKTLKENTDLDGFALCSDYCLNTGPFLSPKQFSEFVAPYLKRLIAGYREMGFYTIKHTDGNIMPIIDQLVDCNPHALHSIDPQAKVDIAEVKRLYGDKVCLIGNVNCGLLQTGTEEECIESARYALKSGMPNYGYIFSTSNCVYTGMALERYELILNILRTEGIYS